MDDDQSTPLAQPRKLGRLLSDSLNLALAGFSDCVVIIVPMIVFSFLAATVQVALGMGDSESFKAAVLLRQFPKVGVASLIGIVAKLFNLLGYIALVFSLSARDDGQALGFSEAYRRAAERFSAALITYILISLCIFGGMLLFIVPGIILAIRYGLAHLSVLLEDCQGNAALKRSKQIMLAHMGKVIGNAIVMFLIDRVLWGIVFTGFALLSGLIFGDSQVTNGYVSIFSFGIKVVGVWMTAFTILLYKDLAALHPDASA